MAFKTIHKIQGFIKARNLLVILCLCLVGCSLPGRDPFLKRYETQAARVTIVRDSWGVPHVYGKTDADAVFGIMYAQCEESFERVERNYIKRLGRLAEIEGVTRLYDDLKMRLLYDTTAAKADYMQSPPWLKTLLAAFADGINFYLYRHPEARPLLLTHFEPWYPLMMPDGAFISTPDGGLTEDDMRNLYDNESKKSTASLQQGSVTPWPTRGSNGFALAARKTASGKAMLFINPHVTFDFRMEGHMVSEEGLNAYGAFTWGQFFVFQGFNEHCGWMHTSSMADAADLYEEHITRIGDSLYYTYDGNLKRVSKKPVHVYYEDDGRKDHVFTTYATHHGPVVGSRGSKWLSLKQQSRYGAGLIQSWERTKAGDLGSFTKSMELKANHSTNTLYADNKGNIAYWHGNFIPRRDNAYDWTLPVRGDTSATEWNGAHELGEIFHLLNPEAGWLQNCNSSPFTAAGFPALRRDSLPWYVAPEGENFRSLQAIQALGSRNNFTIDSLVALGTNPYLPAFDSLLPPLIADFARLPVGDSLRLRLSGPMRLLSAWDRRSAVSSVATTLAVFWGYTLLSNSDYGALTGERASHQVELFGKIVHAATSNKRLVMLSEVVAALEKLYGTWKIAWGEVNRYQRISGHVYPQFDDREQSFPVGYASALFGSLPSFETQWSETKKGYGVAGNSFVAVVEFAEKIKAKSIVPGGQSFDRRHKHFLDQAELYIEGRFKDIWFYKEDVLRNKERSYHPGQ